MPFKVSTRDYLPPKSKFFKVLKDSTYITRLVLSMAPFNGHGFVGMLCSELVVDLE